MRVVITAVPSIVRIRVLGADFVMPLIEEANMSVSLEEVQQIAGQLSPHDQVPLIEHLSRPIAPALATTPTASPQSKDAWTELARLRAELAALPASRLQRAACS
jgi:hypothetical protein